MRALIYTISNPSLGIKALVGQWTGMATRIINRVYRKSVGAERRTGCHPVLRRRVLAAAVALALVLQMVPLAPPPPSQVVTTLLADAPPPISSRVPFLAKVLAPFDGTASLLTTVPTPAIAAGAEITKTARSEVDQDGTITYTLAIRQSTGSDWPEGTVYVTDATPANTVLVGGTPADGWLYVPEGAFINFFSPVTQSTWITVGVLSVQANKPLPDGTIISNTDYAVSATVRAAGLPVTTEVRAPAFSINKTASSSSLCAGSLLTYTLSVSNTGRVTTVKPFTISDVVPSNVSFVSASDGGSYIAASRTVTWTDDRPLPKDGGTTITRTLVISVPYTLADGTPVANIIYTVFSDANEVTPAGVGPASVVTVSKVMPSFSVGSPACVGSPVTFINTSAGATAYEWDFGDGSPVVTETHPIHVFTSTRVVTLTATGTCGTAVFTDTVTVNPLPTPTLQINPTTAAVCTTVYFTDTDTSNVVTRTWDFGDGQITTTLVLTTTSHSYAVPIGTYTVTLTSTTPSGCFISTQKPLTLTAGLPASITLTADPPALPIDYTSLLTATVTDCGGNPVANGTLITFTSSPAWSTVNPITGTTNSGVATSTVTGVFPGGTATVTATAPTLVWMTTTVEFRAPELAVSKAVQPPTVVSGDTITYTLFYSNTGLAPAQSVCLTDTLPAGVSYGGWVGENPSRFGPPTYNPGPPQILTWCTPTLGSGASGTIVITATVNPTDVVSAVFTNTVEISSTTPESNGDNNVDQASNQLFQKADVTISKSVTPSTTLHPNDLLTYTLTFANLGYATATGVLITDFYQPLSLTVVFSNSSGATVTPGPATPPTYTWAVQDLGYGEGGIITITARLDAQPWPPVPTVVTNTALITTTTPDGNAGNDRDQRASTILPGMAYTVTYEVPGSLPRCGAAVVTATVTDRWDNPVQDGTVVSLTCGFGLSFRESGGASYYSLTRDGVVTATLVAGSSSGLSFTQAQAGGADSGFKLINITAEVVLTLISVTANPSTLWADGSSTSVVSAGVAHCGGVASGVVVTFTISPALGSFPSTPYVATTDASGIATGTLTAGMTPGLATVTVTADSLAATTPVTFTGLGSIWVTANPGSLLANGSSTSSVTAVVRDTFGLPVSGVVVTFTISPALGTFPSTPYMATTDASGIATATLTAGTIAGTASVTATAGPLEGMGLVTFTAAPTGGDVYLPIIMRNWDGSIPPTPTGDLVVTYIAFDPMPPLVGQTYHVTVTIRNSGTLPVTNDFWVDLYLNPPETPAVNDIWCVYCPGGCAQPPGTCYGAAWRVTTDLAPGATLDLHTSQVVGDNDYSNWPPPVYSSSHSPFYAQVDSWGFWYGGVYETDETNNVHCRNADGSICLSLPALSSDTVSPGSRPSGSWEPRPILPP